MDDFDIGGGYDFGNDDYDSGWGFGSDIDLTDTSTSTGDTDYSVGEGGYSPPMEFGSDTSNEATGGSDGGSNMWGSVASGAAAGSAFGPWGTVIGAGLGLVSSFFGGKEKTQAQKDQEKLSEKLYAANRAVDEQYYQKHGEQLATAYQGYKKYNPAPGTPGPTSQFGLVSPGGPSGYFH